VLITIDSVRSLRSVCCKSYEAKSGNGFYINKKHAGGVPVPGTHLIRNFT